MHTTKQLLRKLARTWGKTTDGQLAEILEISRQQMSNYRTGRRFPDDDVARRLALRLGMNPGYVLACVHAERESDPALREIWEGMAAAMLGRFNFGDGPPVKPVSPGAKRRGLAASIAAVGVAALLSVASPGAARAAADSAVKSAGYDLYIMRRSLRRSRRRRAATSPNWVIQPRRRRPIRYAS